MVEIRIRETNHGGRSVAIISGEESIPEYKPAKVKENMVLVTPSNLPSTETKEKKKPKKAEIVHRVANRLGWVSTSTPDETISILSNEAKKMGEDPFKYLQTLAKLGEKFCKEEPECIRCPMRERCRYRLKKKMIA